MKASVSAGLLIGSEIVMKRTSFLILGLAVAAPFVTIPPSHAQVRGQAAVDFQSSWSEGQREVWRIIEAWNDAFEANDPDRYFTYVDPAITVITSSNPYRVEGLPDDRREFEFGIDRGYSRVGLFQEIQPRVVVGSDMAFATYYSRGWYGPEGEGRMAYFKETDVLVRRPGGWKIIHIHVSSAN